MYYSSLTFNWLHEFKLYKQFSIFVSDNSVCAQATLSGSSGYGSELAKPLPDHFLPFLTLGGVYESESGAEFIVREYFPSWNSMCYT